MAAHHHHETSLEGALNLSSSPLAGHLRIQAEHRFHEITHHFRDRDPDPSKYDRPRLVSLVHRHALSQKSKDNVLRAVFRAMELPMEGGPVDFSAEDALLSRLIGFADHLINNFFMPLRASTARTPQPTPHYRSATLRSSSRDFIGTPERLSTLRGDCLIRDKHRCVISRVFDKARAEEQAAAEVILDDDNHPIDDDRFDYLEVAHIMPHSLVHVGSESEGLSESRKTALEILNMFDNDIAHRISGVGIDRPFNALTLTHSLHRAFGDFQVYLTPIPGRLHTYEIKTFQRTSFPMVSLPITRTLYLTENRNIEPPSPQLLAVHNAIAHILHLSGAGLYIERIIRAMEDQTARSDGSTDLGQLVRLRAQGWTASVVNT